MGEGHTDNISGVNPPTLPEQATDHLRRVFAAATDVSTATAYREDDSDRIFFCTVIPNPDTGGIDGAMSAVIPLPADSSVVATVDGGGGAVAPGENPVDYYGYASEDVAYVIVTTPDHHDHLAAVAGHVWWAAPVLDEATASRSREGTWRAMDRAGTVLAEGKA